MLASTSRGPYLAVTSADALGLADQSFDAVVLSMVLHHVDAERGMLEAARVLAPGGILLILGYGRFGGLRDVPYELRDVLAHRLVSRRMRHWEPATVKADPADTWRGTKRPRTVSYQAANIAGFPCGATSSNGESPPRERPDHTLMPLIVRTHLADERADDRVIYIRFS